MNVGLVVCYHLGKKLREKEACIEQEVLSGSSCPCILLAGASVAVADTPYETVNVIHTSEEGFDLEATWDEGSDTPYLRVLNGKAGAIFKWEGEHGPSISQSSQGSNVVLTVIGSESAYPASAGAPGHSTLDFSLTGDRPAALELTWELEEAV